jgi:predicted secreted Zn-dependent protease
MAIPREDRIRALQDCKENALAEQRKRLAETKAVYDKKIAAIRKAEKKTDSRRFHSRMILAGVLLLGESKENESLRKQMKAVFERQLKGAEREIEKSNLEYLVKLVSPAQ